MTPERLIIIAGSESSGNRLWKKVLVASTSFEDDPSKADSWWLGNTIKLLHSTVIRRSLPTGPMGRGRHFPNLFQFADRAKSSGARVQFVLPTRDRTAIIRSKARVHTGGDLELAEKELGRAARLQSDILRVYGPAAVVVSYEALMLLKADYVAQVLGLLELSPTFAKTPDLHDGNLKYFKGGTG